MSIIADNIADVRQVIEAACARVGRRSSEVTLVAVSKTHAPEAVLEAVECGVQHLGENRVEEAGIKIPQVNARLSFPLTWHMIGHIQSRKAREVAPLFQVIQSVDSVRLASKLSALAVESAGTIEVLLEINISGEEAKYGFHASSWEQNPGVRNHLWQEIVQVVQMPGLHVRGLMTMAPLVEHAEQSRPVFAGLAALREALSQSLLISLPDLSMGMTDDYAVGIEEGATLIRVGRAVFGNRKK